MNPSSDALWSTDLPLPGCRRGKVRDVYDILPTPGGLAGPGGARSGPGLLIVASDRISAFDVVMPTPITGKGRLLTELSLRWFAFIESKGLGPTHLLDDSPDGVPGLTERQKAILRGRAVVARRCRVVPIECVVRGYLDGSGWEEYRAHGAVCGEPLPAGLRRGDKLPKPIFTPATKEAVGTHDQNITFERACQIAGTPVMSELRARSLAIYGAAHDDASGRGLILADTKFEFGFPLDERGHDTGEGPILVDEALTPDSSRYWDAAKWAPGGEQASFDKQFLREHLKRLVDQGTWNKAAPGPQLPPEIVEGTRRRYDEVLRRLFP